MSAHCGRKAAPPSSEWLALLRPPRWAVTRRPRLATAITAGLLGAAFAIAYGQGPLYAGNQVTYLLRPFAQAGHGFLAHDWLANTAERMPATSLLVRLTVEHIDEVLVQLYQPLVLGIYGFALTGLAAFTMRRPTRPAMWAWLAIVLAVHIDDGLDVLTSGVAGQSAALSVFEPATFGTLLVLSLYLFARERHLLAIACLGVAATAHPTYLLPGALIALAYAGVTLRRDRRARLAAGMLGLYAALAAPIAAYTLITFRPDSPALHARATAILFERIPYHADPTVWLQAGDAVRVVLVLVAACIVRRTRLGPVLLGLLAVGAALAVVQVATGSRDLGLLFPWRVSVLLVPAATSVVVAAVVDGRRERWVAIAGVTVVLAICAVRAVTFIDVLGERDTDAEPISAYVERHKRPDDVFLLPVGPRVQQIEYWSRFRLRTGAPIYVDLKSHPLRDREVIEWWRRVQTARRVYRFGFPPCHELRRLNRTAGVTAIVVASAAPPPAGCAVVRLDYRDPQWSLYRIAA